MAPTEAETPENGGRGRVDPSGPIRADAPIEHRSEDLLQRVPLADAIADQVIHGPTGHGLVIGLVGRWGSGKTSVLKMVEEVVRETSNTIVLTFNPWLFSDADQLVSRFLEELGAQLRKESVKKGADPKLGQAADRLMSYAESLAPLSWLPVLGPWLGRLSSASRVIKKVKEAHLGLPSVEDQRERLREELRGLDSRVLVIVDDLDRIEAEQIRDMVRLIKLVGDFPNTTYLVSFDREPVERALGETATEGAVYLEKIIQIVHSLPEPPPEAIQRMLVEGLDELVNALPTGPFSAEDWQNIQPEGFMPFFRTLRDVRRYLNTVAVSLRVIEREVALVDVLALEAIRVFVPTAYEELAISVAALTREGLGSYMGAAQREREEADAQRVKAIVEAANDLSEPVEEILKRLFPAAAHGLGGIRLVGGEQKARRELRVADPGVLRTYLRRTLPPDVISGALVRQAVEALSRPTELSEIFESLDSATTEGLIERLEDFEQTYDPSWVEPALPVLLNQLHRLREGRRGLLGSAEVTVARVALRLLRKIDSEDERLGIVQRVLPEVESLSGRLELIDMVGHREGAGHKLVSEEAAAHLYDEFDKQLLSTPPDALATERTLVHILARVGEKEEGRAWIQAMCRDDGVMLRLLRAGLGERTSQALGEYAVTVRPSLPWELYQEWLGDAQLKGRVEHLASRAGNEDLPDRTQKALAAAQRYATGELSNAQDA